MVTEVKTQTAGEGIAEVLVANDLTTGFGIPGIHNLGLYDALAGEPRIKHFVVRHEQGAGFAADGFSRVSGKPGLAITTTGPGAFNALTAISEAYLDSSPVLLLAGQIDHDYIGRDWGILHEHIDQAEVFQQVTKFQGRPRTADAAAVDGERRHPFDADGAQPAGLRRAADRPPRRPPDRASRHGRGGAPEDRARSCPGRGGRAPALPGEAAADHRGHRRHPRLGRQGADAPGRAPPGPA